jgi:GTP-binding protein HflX
METILERPVMDRYNVILQIFHKHAQTKEAKLQVQLAEIPYLKARLLGDLDVENESKHSKSRKGAEYFDKQRLALNKREKAIKSAIEKIKTQRSILRSNRINGQIPTVAVIGYTNSGKTSLIKAITGTDKLEPKNELFATLDVTAHPTTMPSQLTSMLIDTVGFISDIPTDLIASFNATLEDAALADILIHVRDVSNPDHVAQNDNVLKTLERLQIPDRLMSNMITVGNKVDNVPESDWDMIRNDGMIPISTKEGLNMAELVNLVDEMLIRVTGRKKESFRVATGSPEYLYLMQSVTVSDIWTDPDDTNYTVIDAIILDYERTRFQKRFQVSSLN